MKGEIRNFIQLSSMQKFSQKWVRGRVLPTNGPAIKGVCDALRR
jgi:hypothetical protein